MHRSFLWPNGIIFHQRRFPCNFRGFPSSATKIGGRGRWGCYNLTRIEVNSLRCLATSKKIPLSEQITWLQLLCIGLVPEFGTQETQKKKTILRIWPWSKMLQIAWKSTMKVDVNWITPRKTNGWAGTLKIQWVSEFCSSPYNIKTRVWLPNAPCIQMQEVIFMFDLRGQGNHQNKWNHTVVYGSLWVSKLSTLFYHSEKDGKWL